MLGERGGAPGAPRPAGMNDPASAAGAFDRVAFDSWLAAFVSTDQAARAAELRRGRALLSGRRAWMEDLIERDPERALEAAVVPSDRAALPVELRALLETPVSAMGALEVEVACGLRHGTSQTRRFVELDDGRRLRAFTYGRRLQVPCKDRISINGIEVGGRVAVESKPLRELSAYEREQRGGFAAGEVLAEVGGEVLRFADRTAFGIAVANLEREEGMLGPQPRAAYLGLAGGDGAGIAAPEAESAWTEGAKRILYLRVQFSDDDPGRLDLSDANARSRQDDVEEFLEINSYDKSQWSTTIPDAITLENTFAYYQGAGWSAMLNDARALAIPLGQAQGEDWDYRNYDFYTVVSRGGIGGYAGVAQVGGRRSHLQDSSLRTAGHEFGHNIGLGHAYYHYTKSLSPRGDSTYEGLQGVEYGHRFSIQSAQSGGDFNNPTRPHFTAHEKWQLDWLTDADVLDIVGPGSNGVHRVFQNDRRAATGLRALRLPSGGAMAKYWVSYRAAWPNNDYLSNGAVVDWAGGGGGRSTLLDMTPYSDDGSHSGADWTRDNRDKWDAALAIGRTYSDHASGVHVTPLARGGVAPDEYLDLFVHVEGGEATTLIAETAPCRAVVPDASTPGGWAEPGFDDTAWAAGNLGVGYERNSGYGGLFAVDLEAGMYNRNESAYVRVPFEIADAAGAAFHSLSLQIRYDDGFVAYLNGVEVAQDHAPAAPAWNSGATSNHSDSSAVNFADFDVSPAIGQLVVGTNVLAIHGLNDGATSSDFLIQPRLVGVRSTDANGPPVVALSAGALSVPVGAPVAFAAAASDPDGDALSYAWHFDEGDAYVAEGQNSESATKSWGTPGQYLVRVTCSDRKGGVAEDSAVVTVGSPANDRQIRGRVLRGGEPLAGVRVSGGGKATTSLQDGSYALVGLAAGAHTVEAIADGEVLVAALPNPVAPAPVEWGADFWAIGRGSAPGSLTVSPHRATVVVGETLGLAASIWDNAAPADEALIPFGATWRYLDDGSDQGSAWRAPGFDDSTWAQGPAQLGFGEGDEATEVSFGGDPENVHITTYFRRAFEVADAAGISRARLRLRRDDGVVVYLNGAELLRENLTSGSVGAGTEARNEISGSAAEGEVLEFAVDPALLVEGVNTLAVEVHQEAPDSGDLSFDLELIAVRNLSAVTPAWSTGTGASVDAAGVFSASAPGVYTVTATSGGLSGSAEIAVPSDLVVSVEAIDAVGSEHAADGGLVRVWRNESGGALTVELTVGGDATAGGDYGALPAAVTFADGEPSIDLAVEILDDSEVEGRESIVVGVAPSMSYSIGAPGAATVWIEDDDFAALPPEVSISAPGEATVGVPLPLEGQATALSTLLERGSAWRYLDDGSDQGSAWRGPAFDDSAWGAGFGPLGYGDGDETTVVDEGGSPKAITTYFRRRFGVGPFAGAGGLRLEMQRDDGAVVYLDGDEVLRVNMPGGPIGSITPASATVGGDDEDTYFVDDLPGVVAGDGDHVLAVEVHQASTGSSDISFDLAVTLRSSPALHWEKRSGPGDVVFSAVDAPAPTATFSSPGDYVLRLTATDGAQQAIAEVSVSVGGRNYASWVAGYPALAEPDPLADPDGDSLLNLFEYAFGGDPGAYGDADRSPGAIADGDAVMLRYRRIAGGTEVAGGYEVDGIRYRIEAGTDLDGWALAAEHFVVEGAGIPVDLGDGTETVTLRLRPAPDAPESARWFLRVTVEELVEP